MWNDNQEVLAGKGLCTNLLYNEYYKQAQIFRRQRRDIIKQAQTNHPNQKNDAITKNT